jgi:hypothetical protein
MREVTLSECREGCRRLQANAPSVVPGHWRQTRLIGRFLKHKITPFNLVWLDVAQKSQCTRPMPGFSTGVDRIIDSLIPSASSTAMCNENHQSQKRLPAMTRSSNSIITQDASHTPFPGLHTSPWPCNLARSIHAPDSAGPTPKPSSSIYRLIGINSCAPNQ